MTADDLARIIVFIGLASCLAIALCTTSHGFFFWLRRPEFEHDTVDSGHDNNSDFILEHHHYIFM